MVFGLKMRFLGFFRCFTEAKVRPNDAKVIPDSANFVQNGAKCIHF